MLRVSDPDVITAIQNSVNINVDVKYTTEPTFVSAITSTEGTKVLLNYNENLPTTTATPSDFVVNIDGSAASMSRASSSGSTLFGMARGLRRIW